MRKRSALWTLGVTLLIALAGAISATSAGAALEFEEVSVDLHESGPGPRQAGGHPDLTTKFAIRTDPSSSPLNPMPKEEIRDVDVTLPPGFVGNPTAAAECPPKDLVNDGFGAAACSAESQVGEADLTVKIGAPEVLERGIYNLEHPPTSPALFGFNFQGAIVLISGNLDPRENRIEAASGAISQVFPLLAVETTFWGVPADPIHDAQREGPNRTVGVSSALPRTPFLTAPTDCQPSPLAFGFRGDSWETPGVFATAEVSADLGGGPFVYGGCDRVPFSPTMNVAASSRRSESPTGLSVELKVPQNQTPEGIATSDVKSVSVTLPKGMAVSSSSAAGLGACGPSEIGLGTDSVPSCPPSSKIGTVEVVTPLLKEALKGEVILARQKENPFGSNFAMYVVVDGPGFYLKLPGRIDTDPTTGQVTTTFSDTPQLPFEALSLQLNTGARAPLTTPGRCGTYPVQSEVVPWSGTRPVHFESQIKISEGCSTGGFAPGLKAGTANPTGGSFSPFTLQVTRSDGESNLSRISATLPPGLLAKLAGVPLCGDAQAASGNCPAASRVGTTTIGVGPGSSPIYVPEAGKAPTAVYLGGPYEGAPYSLVVKVPAQAGPFDLGTVVVRNALRIDPTTTQVTAESDPLPQILEGIPVSYRDVRVEINRPEFTVNPTNCSQFQVTSVLVSSSNQTATPKAPFAAADCEALAFDPTLALRLTGQTRRAGDPALTATLKAPAGQANIASTAVILPRTVFIDQRHVSNPCTRVQFAADACPPRSVLGTAVAYSPLLDRPLEGPVYFRSNGGERRLPDIVADLGGQIHVVLVGFVDSKKVGREGSLVRTRFASVPDAPVSRFVLRLKGGSRSLIQNSANLCRTRSRAEVGMTGQNGRTHDFEQPIAVKCARGRSKGHRD